PIIGVDPGPHRPGHLMRMLELFAGMPFHAFFVEDLEGEQHEKLLTPGDFGFVPKNCVHAYRMERHHSQVVGVAAGPGGTFERFFESLGTPAEELGLPARPFVPEREKFRTVPEQYDVRFRPDHQWRTES
ncbi:hypothetical protein AB0F45_27130, partial [Streptomyces achromogenes]